MTRRLLLVPLAMVSLVVPLAAHHSIAGVYDRNQQTTLDGTVTDFRFVNPHPYIVVTVARGGTGEAWKLEMDNRYELAAIGVSAETIKPGDRVRASGSRARDGSTSLYLLRLDRERDGFWYEQVGSSPRVGRGR